MKKVSFNDWKKLELKVGKIVAVDRVPKTDKLYRLQVDVGASQPIRLITSLVPYYSKDELINKKIVVLTNLEPAKFAGEISEGMLLCAEKHDHSQCVLLTVDKDIKPGTPIT